MNEISAEQQKSWREEAVRFAQTANDRVPPEILAAAEAAIAKYRNAGKAGAPR